MAEYIRMPQKGLTEEFALLAEWYVKKGDTVKAGQPLFALETGKAAFDVESEVSGTVLDLFANEGEEIPIKAIVMVVGAPGENYDPETVRASGISSEKVGTGEKPQSPVLQAAGSQATTTPAGASPDAALSAPTAGSQTTITPAAGSPPRTSQDLAHAASLSTLPSPTPAPVPAVTPGPPVTGPARPITPARRLKISPRARKLAEARGVPVDRIEGTGPGGRIIVDDVNAAIESGYEAAAARAVAAPMAPPPAAGAAGTVAETAARIAARRAAGADMTGAAAVTGNAAGSAAAAAGTGHMAAGAAAVTGTGKGEAAALSTAISSFGIPTRSIPVSKMRSVIANRLSASFFTAPHAFLRIALEVDHLFNTRSRINAELRKTLSLNAFFIKLTAETLKRHPVINATWNGDTIELFESIDIGLAVALPEGLITPIVRNCGNKGVEEISDEMSDLIEKAQKGELLPEQFTGATFTISNLGSYGLEEFTAIINPPGSAILALGEAVKEQVVTEDDNVEIRKRMRATLSVDHRVIDGAAGAAFLHDLKLSTEEPLRILLTSRSRSDD